MLRFDPTSSVVDLRLGAASLYRLRVSEPDESAWQRLLAVRIEDDVTSPSLPPMLGHYAIDHDRVCFRPRFSFVPGLRYLATANPSAISDEPTPAPLRFSVAAPPADPLARVACVYPSAAILPENLLRIYVHFSAPMQRGAVRSAIALRGSDGKSVPAAFLDLPTELWDPMMRRLTLILHPGRIKRGVGLDAYAAPALRDGEHCTVTIDDAMRDATGRRLAHGFVKSFRVCAALRVAIDPYRWGLAAPSEGSRQPLVLRFAAPLDRALLARTIRVTSAEGVPLAGHVVVDRCETRWSFTPAMKWNATPHLLQVGADLEDICGNRISTPFDAPPGQAGTSKFGKLRFMPVSQRASCRSN